VEEAAKKAKLDDLIGSWKDGYETIIGERGVKLSGGQRQRIGIARALYKQADLLVFDEATNALDSNTEREVMNAINNLDKDLTILIIAHRLTTLKQCDEIISIESGGELNVGSYKEMVGAD
jgi:ATP-binding cassette subfamily B protein